VIPALQESRQAVRRAGKATTFLVVLSAMLMGVLVLTFTYLNMRQNELQDGIREDALWAVYQLDREARALAHRADHALLTWPLETEELDELALRYDILYSRLSVLENAKYEVSLSNSASFLSGRNAVRERIKGVQAHFDGLAATGQLDRAELEVIASEMTALIPATERMLGDTNTSISAVRADARAEVMQIQHATVIVVAISSFSIFLLILNLMRQLRFMRRTTGQLETAASEISEAYKAAEAGNRAKSEFMAVMGHEIRTPLNAILGMAELLATADLPEKDREGVRVITSSGQALLEIINEILDFAKIEHGDLVLDTVPFNPRRLAEETLKVIGGRASEQGIALRIVVEDAAGSGTVLLDPTRIRRVLLNLLSNAVKFTQNGHVELRVHRPAANLLRFEIEDTGIGISAEALPRLFNPFTQEDSTISRRFGGTGLGLAICKKTIEAMGGTIGVDSTLGVGSLFWFELPVEAVATERDEEAGTNCAEASLPVLDVLVVEDNAVNREVARRFLERLGQRVTMAVDGAQGVEMAAGGRYDLILMDMQMPVMDGIAATVAIRSGEAETGRHVPIVAMTANASDADRTLCLEAGMDAFVAKPVTLAALGAILRNAAPASAHAPENETELPVDPARRAELAETFGAAGLNDLDESFFAEMSDLLRKLHEALQAADMGMADRALHSMKGSASNLGYMELASFAERARGQSDASLAETGIEQRLSALKTAWEQARAA
jgi:two-component system, sensor histidine kinase